MTWNILYVSIALLSFNELKEIRGTLTEDGNAEASRPPSIVGDSKTDNSLVTYVAVVNTSRHTSKKSVSRSKRESETTFKQVDVGTGQTIRKGTQSSMTPSKKETQLDLTTEMASITSTGDVHTTPHTSEKSVGEAIAATDAEENGGRSTASCHKSSETLTTNFGKFGILGFSVCLAITFMSLCAFFVLLCFLQRKRKKPSKNRFHVENASDMRKPSAIYRPRPSVTSPCVPTPLAMIMDESDMPLTPSFKQPASEAKVILLTDLDETLDLAEIQTEAPGSVGFFQGNTAAVSTFLLRQNSRHDEAGRRNSSLRDSNSTPPWSH